MIGGLDHYVMYELGKRGLEEMSKYVDRDEMRIWNQASREVWAQVRAFHAECQVEHPKIKLRDTATALLNCGLMHRAEVMMHLKGSQRDEE